MCDLKNIFLYEHSPEAIEAVESGKARISPGGIIRVGDSGKGFRELARPARMSVADFKSLFEGKDHALETDERLNHLSERLALSEEGLEETRDIAWINNTAIQRTYVMTYEGFRQTLQGIEGVASQMSQFEEYVRQRDRKELAEKVQTYINYLNTDAGDLRSKKYSATNGKAAEHLDQISALMKRLLNDVEKDETDSYLAAQVLINLLQPFTYVTRKYSALYYYENDGELMPGGYEEWVNTISAVANSKKFKDRLEYYIHLKLEISYRDKVVLSKTLRALPSKLLSDVRFEKGYIKSHSKEDYLSLHMRIQNKIESKDYLVKNGSILIFLNDKKSDNLK